MNKNDIHNRIPTEQTAKTASTTNRYQMLFEHISIAIHETELSGVQHQLNELRKEGVEDINDYLDNHPLFAQELFSTIKTFDANQAMVDLIEAPSKAYYIEHLREVYASLRIDFFKKIIHAIYNDIQEIKIETLIKTFANNIKWVEINANYYIEHDCERLVYLIKDVTEKKQKDNAIKLINSRLRRGKIDNHLDNLVLALCEAFDFPYAYISHANAARTKVKTLSICINGKIIGNEIYDITDVPDALIYQHKKPLTIRENFKKRFPNSKNIQDWQAEGYMGFPILNSDEDILGVLAIIDNKPIIQFELIKEVMELYVTSAAAELERTKNENIIAEQEHTLDLFINSTEDVFYVIDKEYYTLAFNKAAERVFRNYFNMPIEIGTPIVKEGNTIPEGMLERHNEMYKKAFEGKSTTYTDTFPTPSGTFYFTMTFSPIKKENGEIIGSTVISKNITKSYLAEQKLRFEEGRYKLLFEHVSDSIIIYDLNKDKRIHCNQSYIDLTGYSLEEFLNLPTADTMPEFQENGQNSLEFIAELNKTAITEGSSRGEMQFLKKNREIIYLNFESISFSFEDENLLISIFKDITELKKRERTIKAQLQELDNKNAQLEKYIESNLQLENFAYIASHDMKTPIRTMVSFSQLLKRRLKAQLDEASTEYIDFIVSASKNMQQLIDDLLLFSRVNTNEHNFSEIPLQSLLYTIKYEIGSAIEESHGEIFTENIPEVIIGDYTNIKQTFQNLITNALKFHQPHQPPKVWVTAKEKSTHWLFSIQDNGIGIAPEFHDKIFLMFKKLHHKSEYEGTGIGLSICKRIVEQHKGKIWLESEIGKGTTFFFTIAKKG